MSVSPKAASSPWTFFALVFALSIPFWLAGALTGLQIVPGLPLAALMFVCPVLAAALLAYRGNSTIGVAALLKRSFDLGRGKRAGWFALAAILMPGVMAASFVTMRAMGVLVPTPQFSVVTTLALFGALFVAALGEELGWMGYAIDPLQQRWGVLGGSVLLGAVWAAWHFIPLIQAHRAPDWIAWWCLYSLAARVLIVWLYNKTGGSVFVAALFHTMAAVAAIAVTVWPSQPRPGAASAQ